MRLSGSARPTRPTNSQTYISRNPSVKALTSNSIYIQGLSPGDDKLS